MKVEGMAVMQLIREDRKRIMQGLMFLVILKHLIKEDCMLTFGYNRTS